MTEVTSPTTWQEHVPAKSNENARTGSPIFVVLRRKRMEHEAKGCAILGLPKPFSADAVYEVVARKLKVTGTR